MKSAAASERAISVSSLPRTNCVSAATRSGLASIVIHGWWVGVVPLHAVELTAVAMLAAGCATLADPASDSTRQTM